MSAIDFSSFLNDISKTPLFVMDENIPIEKYTLLDLSISNIALRDIDVGESANLEHYINNHIATKNALVAYGGYNEIRNIYQRSTYFNQTDIETERNIHIGMDLWIASETPIYAPLYGTVHSYKNNTNHGDYGPTIILRHSIKETDFLRFTAI